MKPIYRSLAGLGIAAILLPVVISLVACLPVLPVPIGDPEKSRVDPEMAGVWFDVLQENLWLIEPHDRRTYLITLYEFEPVDCVLPPDEWLGEEEEGAPGQDATEQPPAESMADTKADGDVDSEAGIDIEEIVITPRSRPGWYDGELDADAALTWYKSFMIAVRQDCDGEATGREVHKAWLTRLGKRTFLTMETTGIVNEQAGFDPDFWFVWRISRPNGDAIELDLVSSEFEGFEGIDETRKAFESVIRKQANNPDLTIREPLLLLRVPRHDLEFIANSIVTEPWKILVGPM